MMNKLIGLTLGIGLALAASLSSAVAETTVIKLGYGSEGDLRLPGTPRSAGLAAFKHYIEVGSGGEIQVELHPDRALGNERTMIESTQLGVIQMVSAYTSIMSSFAPELSVTQIPYIFRDNLVAWKVMEGPVGDDLVDAFLKRTGLRVIGWGDGAGFRNIYTKTPIKGPADLQGMKMRVPENPGLLAMFRAWGADTITITWSELYTGLQTGMAEGTDTELYSMYGKKLYEVTPYVTMSKHSYNLQPLMINEAFFQSLSPEYQRLILQGGDLYERVANAQSILSALTVQKKMEDQGAVFYFPTEEEINQFKELGQRPYIETIVNKLGGDEGQVLVDKIIAAAISAESQH